MVWARIYWFSVGAGFLGTVLFLSACGQKGPLYVPPRKAEIRFYSMNEQQQRELVLVPGAGQAGCHNLPLDTLRGVCPAIDNNVFEVLSLDGSVQSRDHIGGTAPAQVRYQIQTARTRSKQR